MFSYQDGQVSLYANSEERLRVFGFRIDCLAPLWAWGGFVNLSDARFKTNVTSLEGALAGSKPCGAWRSSGV